MIFQLIPTISLVSVVWYFCSVTVALILRKDGHGDCWEKREKETEREREREERVRFCLQCFMHSWRVR